MKHLFFFFTLCLICFSCQPEYDVPVKIELNTNWQFKKVTDSVWQSATVPGNVHSDLLVLGLIEDPFIGKNEENVQWVSETDWEYKTTFSLDEETLQKKNFELNFEGLDTYASVYLNDSLILSANNAFRTWNVNVKSLLKTENEIRILFESTSKFEEAEKEKLSYELPEGERIFTRKAQFQYGWDWGPKLNTSGIWRPIKLVAWNDYKIREIDIKQIKLNDSIADILLDVKKLSNVELDKNLTYKIYINDKLMKTPNEVLKGYTWATRLQLKNPKRWWPHNLGEPYLYDIKVVVKEENKILDSISIKKGLRTIELVAEKDSIGESFYFKVNDVPVYAKGANYIPQNSFQNNVTDAHYEKLLNDVVDANMNMLRVWGGGIYENDIFYDLCDEKGILVWQDFMFACAMYPGDDDFLGNVQQEASYNVKRLRNHASIALWCGNNENSEGWHRWGWQDGRSEEDKEEIWNNYLKVFDSILPNTVEQLTDTDYWESSPKYGRGNPKYKTEGDAHDWWIWHDGYPFEHLEENVPRFMSEFGFQSFPSYETIRFINQNDSLEITSEGFKNHQKHSSGFQFIEDYMKRDFPVPESPEDYVYMSQVLQAYGITKGIEAQRRAKPYNMGTLYWQLNDCWPAVSWSSIDYFGNWKALHYNAKRSFENLFISSKVENGILETWIVNDDLNEYNDDLLIKIIDFDGNILWLTLEKATVNSNSSDIKRETDLRDLNLAESEVVVVSYFKNKRNLHYLVKPKDLKLKQAEIQQTISKTKDGFKIELSSKTLQKDVFLFTKAKGHFSDNFFDLLPNESKTIEFVTQNKKPVNFNIKCINNFIR
ncbi:glycoside hydrolase family 2 protein [Winogradskyella echinorum]|uniref:Beta-mannosidase B n=1 Tax=Winogradskyella echinorum TaxID=538189 RepID=A0ABR6Y016_9FLAO|nr:glycoside hydrolase family 2 protein [Winogradskyella echinorum]MBC3846099.1 glycoside hydrolase family 2 protein [Winogradskyella echinorum]MBC5750447.1 glycoside hydrolase family 2 protein [Winogradskyella echinorum]